MFEQIIFYCFSALLLSAAVAVITVRHPIYAALSLVIVFFSSAAIWLLLLAEFLAIVLILVYVGAVMVLFLFVVMLLDAGDTTVREGFTRFFPLGIIVAGFMAIAMVIVVSANLLVNAPVIEEPEVLVSNTELLGYTLYTEYFYEFEIAGVILLVAIVAAIALTMGKAKDGKSQLPERQVSTIKSERLRIVKMDTEKEV